MSKSKPSIDKILLGITIILVFVGLFIFMSASFGILVRKGDTVVNLFFNKIIWGTFLGIITMFIGMKIPLYLLRVYALPIFIGSILLTLLVFLPHIGFKYGGAHRWVSLGGMSFQPSEILKISTIIYFSMLIQSFKGRLETRRAIIIIGASIIIPITILLFQPDTGTLMVLLVTIIAMLVSGGMRIRYFFLIIIFLVISITALAYARPYVKERVLTFYDSSRDPMGAGYQIQKSLLTIGSGGITGRGFGQSIQKFGALPEPTGDSIFAVAGEEFGFIGGSSIITLFLLLGIRGINIARRAPMMSSGLLAIGIVILIVSQAFINIAAMLGLIPLTGVPLTFISHGGTALIVAFFEIGILLNISKLQRQNYKS